MNNISNMMHKPDDGVKKGDKFQIQQAKKNVRLAKESDNLN
jgi:hypothetical protein